MFVLPEQHLAPLSLILHAAGVLADATISKQSMEGIRAVYGSKLAPALMWQRVVRNNPLAKQVLYSSVASMLGAPGQLNYSGANAALDNLSSSLCQ